jgi:hypothetical protein
MCINVHFRIAYFSLAGFSRRKLDLLSRVNQFQAFMLESIPGRTAHFLADRRFVSRSWHRDGACLF